MAKKIKVTLSQLQAAYLVQILENYADCTEKAAVAMGQVMNLEQDIKVSICADIYAQICSQDKKIDVKTVQQQHREYKAMYDEEMDKLATNN